MRIKAVESPSDRRALAGDAGWGTVSPLSVAAGVLVAYAATALLALAAWAVAVGTSAGAPASAQGWRRLGEGGGIGAGVVLLVAFAFGAYAAGRMARRGGVRNGLLVAVTGIVLAVGMGAAAGGLGAWGPISREIHRLGAPTTWSEWRSPAFVAGIAALVGIILGSLAGGRMGEQWHSKLARRALDPTIGPEAEQRARAARLRTDVTGPATTAGVREEPETIGVRQDEIRQDEIRQEAEHPA